MVHRRGRVRGHAGEKRINLFGSKAFLFEDKEGASAAGWKGLKILYLILRFSFIANGRQETIGQT